MMAQPSEPERLVGRHLASVPGVVHGFFTRRGGLSSGVYASLNCGIGSDDDRDTVLANRGRAASALRVDAEHLASPYQVHGADVAIVEQAWPPGERPEADAIVTKTAGLAIAVGTADCAPVLFADPEAGVIGAAHAGWGGARKGILEATVAAMTTLGARPDRTSAAIGPTIAQESYEVGPEFRERFTTDDPSHDRFFAHGKRSGRFQFGLVDYLVAKLGQMELATISPIGLDTYADEDRFFSFRRTTHRGEADYGRMISAIVLR